MSGPARRLAPAAAAALIWAAWGSASLSACPMCFGAAETSMVDGTKLGVLLLLAVTVAVQGGFVGFFLYLRRRAKQFSEAELDTEWSQLQKTPRSS